VLFRRLLPAEGADEDSNPSSQPTMSTLQLSFPILPHDTILSLEAKIKVLPSTHHRAFRNSHVSRQGAIYSFKEASSEDTNSSEPTAASTSRELVPSQLRLGSISAPLLEAEFNAFVAKYRMITVPIVWDVPLTTFFPVREDLTFDMQVDVE